MSDNDKTAVGKRSGMLAAPQRLSLWVWLAISLLWCMLLRRSYYALPWESDAIFGITYYDLRFTLSAAGMSVGMFASAIALGCMFWLCLSFITGAQWGKKMRSVFAECSWAAMAGILVLVATVCCMTTVIFPDAAAFCGVKSGEARLPGVLNFSIHEWWNPAWLYLRMGGMLTLMWMMGQCLRRLARAGAESPLLKGGAAFCMISLILLSGMLGFDLIGGVKGVSLSMFPVTMCVYVMLTGLAFGTLMSVLLNGRLKEWPWRRVGAMLLAVVLMKGYVAFSQYLIVWYAGISAENAFYAPTSWDAFLIAGLILQVALPFCVLLFPALRRRPSALAVVSMCILTGAMAEALWLYYPALGLNPADALCWVPLCALWGVVMMAVCAVALFPLLRPESYKKHAPMEKEAPHE